MPAIMQIQDKRFPTSFRLIYCVVVDPSGSITVNAVEFLHSPYGRLCPRESECRVLFAKMKDNGFRNRSLLQTTFVYASNGRKCGEGVGPACNQYPGENCAIRIASCIYPFLVRISEQSDQ